MEREKLFAEKLKEVRKLAGLQENCISAEQIKEIFTELSLSEEQLTLVEDYLTGHHIGIGEPVSREDCLTEEEHDYLSFYLEELALLAPVTEEQKYSITLAAISGDEKAGEQLVEIYLPKVPELAMLYTGEGAAIEDLIGEGNLALTVGIAMLDCVEDPEEVQGLFGELIMNSMEAFIAALVEEKEKDGKILEQVNRVAEQAKDLAETLQRKVTAEELSAECGIDMDGILEAVRLSGGRIEEITQK